MNRRIVWGDPLLDELQAEAATETTRPAAAEPSTPISEPPKPSPTGPVIRSGHVTYHHDLIQGSDEWRAARCGMLTASEMKLILTPTLKIASNDKERSHLYELLAQRITKYVEPAYVSDDMLRGINDELIARALYAEHFSPVIEVGFITNDRWGFTIGYSPDALIGVDGLLECKSRRQKFQIETWIENVPDRIPPQDYVLQMQTGMLVSERDWCDLVSFSGGLPMAVIRVFADQRIQDAIIEAAAAFEKKLAIKLAKYEAALRSIAKLIPTERRVEQEMHLG